MEAKESESKKSEGRYASLISQQVMDDRSAALLDEIRARYIENDKKPPKTINVARLARWLGFSPTRLWYGMTARRKWAADIWLKTLYQMKAIEMKEDGILIKVADPEMIELQLNPGNGSQFAENELRNIK